jgi:hypothetical protein
MVFLWLESYAQSDWQFWSSYCVLTRAELVELPLKSYQSILLPAVLVEKSKALTLIRVYKKDVTGFLCASDIDMLLFCL